MFDKDFEVQALSQFKYQGVTETKRYATAKSLFDDGVAIVMKSPLQYHHFMLCIKIGSNHVPGNHTLQGLANLIHAAAQEASKERLVVSEKRGTITNLDVSNKVAKKHQ